MRLANKTFAITGACALVLVGCGVSATQQVRDSIKSIGAAPNLQMVITASAIGPGSAQATKYLSAFSLHIDVSSTKPGIALARAGKYNVSVDVGLYDAGSPVLNIRTVGTSEYFRFDLAPIETLVPQSEVSGLNAFQSLMGKRWFQVPPSYVDQAANQAKPTLASQSKIHGEEVQLVSALNHLINDHSTITAISGGGLRASGTLVSVLKALSPAIQQISGTAPSTTNVTGTYAVSIASSGGTMTSANLSISNGGDAVNVKVIISHLNQTITTPSQVTPIPDSILQQIPPSFNGGIGG